VFFWFFLLVFLVFIMVGNKNGFAFFVLFYMGAKCARRSESQSGTA
jgi:hypothetical protein